MLSLHVIGRTLLAERAIDNLGRLFERSDVRSRFDWEIIDILENPAIAEQACILATPVLIKTTPPPKRSIFGDLSDTDALLEELGIF